MENMFLGFLCVKNRNIRGTFIYLLAYYKFILNPCIILYGRDDIIIIINDNIWSLVLSIGDFFSTLL